MTSKCIFVLVVGLMFVTLSGCALSPVPAIIVTGLVEDATESQASVDRKMALVVGKYQASAETATYLRTISGNKTISVGGFDSFEPGLKSLMCRLGDMVYAPFHAPFSEMIRSGLIENLKAAGAYSAESPVMLTGRLNAIDFSSHSGNWTMSLTIQSCNGKSLTVTDKYEFETSFMVGQTACNNVRDALMPAVHSLLDKAIRDPGFLTLI